MDRLAHRTREAAALLGVHPTTVRRWVADGTLPSFMLGGARRIGADSLRAHIARQEAAEAERRDTRAAEPAPRPMRRNARREDGAAEALAYFAPRRRRGSA